MATYAEAATPDSQARKTAKPVFLKEFDFFGVKKPPREQWISGVELYKSIDPIIPGEYIAGIQRIPGGLWRIYMDNDDARKTLLTHEFALRGKTVPIYSFNPNVKYHFNINTEEPTIRVRIKNIPLSADDGQFKRALELRKCEVKRLYREKLTVDGRLTNSETGDRFAIISFIDTPLPTSMEVGRYRAAVYHKGQPNDRLKCGKCLQTGHNTKDCTNDVICKSCKNSGCCETFRERTGFVVRVVSRKSQPIRDRAQTS